MTTQRQTKEITTPNGHKAVLNEYLTGGELREIQAIMIDGVSAGDLAINTATVSSMSKIPATKIFKAQEQALRFLLVSIDDCLKQEAYQNAMDLREADLKVLMEEAINQMGGYSDKDEKKENSGQ